MRRESSRGVLAALCVFAMILGVLGGRQFFLRFGQSSTEPELHILQRELMGTRWIIQVAPTNQMSAATIRRSIEAAFDEVARVESVMSEWRADSPISAVNAQAGKASVEVPDELRDLILRGKKISEISQGAFDITWKGLGDIWNFRDQLFSPPDEEQLLSALHRVDYRKISVEQNRVGLESSEMSIGLGGIAKGYGVDRAYGVLRDAGLFNFYIDGGGDISVSGLKHGRPWRVAIRHPRKAPTDFLAVAEMSNAAIVTSGDYENFRWVDGRRYHHILDPRTGMPATGCQSVTVVAPLAESADALATAAFVLGPEEGLNLIRQHAETEALMVDASGKVHMTDGFRHVVQMNENP